MADDQNVDPQGGESTQNTNTDPDGGTSGESDKKTTEAPSKLPENLEGKSVLEVAKMYGELERKLGEQSHSVAEAKKLKENFKLLQETFAEHPELAEKVEKALNKRLGVDDDTSDDGNKSDGDASAGVADLRKAHENRVISEFSDKFGLSELKADDRNEVMKKVGAELADMVDPTGRKSMKQVLASVSLDKLPKLLEKAFYLTNMDDIVSGKSDATKLASIGRLSSSSGKSGESGKGLTQSEKQMAKNLGMSEEDYLKNKT